MIIYFRVCEKQQTISNVIRYDNISKTDMLKKCWLSIQQSVIERDKIVIIHDSVSDDTLQYLTDTCNTSQLQLVEVPEHTWDYHQHTVTLIDTLEELSNKYPDELHYIVEDDYLHLPDAISILEANLSNWQHFAVSYDYPDRYINSEATRVVLGSDRHWKLIPSSTMTVIAKGSTWLDHIEALKQAAPTSNDQVFTEIYKTIPCINPMPGLSSHMTQYHMTPIINWNYYWEHIDID